MFSGEQVVSVLRDLEITHVVWIPDSTLGAWERALRSAGTPRLVGVCREGEAWSVAAGLHLGGARPIVILQCTGLFESGDALRNAVHDWGLPLFAIVGYRSYLDQHFLPGDTARRFTEPILDAWAIDWKLVDRPDDLGTLPDHYRQCHGAGRAGAVLLAEGRA